MELLISYEVALSERGFGCISPTQLYKVSQECPPSAALGQQRYIEIGLGTCFLLLKQAPEVYH